MADWLTEIRLFLGIERNTTSHTEKLLSALGAFLGIGAIWLGMHWYFPQGFMHSTGSALMVTSMGATAVLLFAVPHGALSQPWAVLGGHSLSALVGVSCQLLFPDQFWTPALAVGLAVGLMYYGRCIHPPGGATALAAVLGGEQIHQLGYYYLIFPVVINLCFILAIALAFNGLFRWRRYPAHWSVRKPALKLQSDSELNQEDIAAAMIQMDSYLDIPAETLTELLELARNHAEQHSSHPAQIGVGCYYSNGKLGNQWSIRQVIDAADTAAPTKDKVIYKTVAGAGAYDTGLCLRSEFRQWARFEVTPDQSGHWLKVSGK